MIVLDTHALVWWAENQKLSAAAARAIADEQHAGEIAVSSITAWEIARLVQRGRLQLMIDVDDWLDKMGKVPTIASSRWTTALPSLQLRCRATSTPTRPTESSSPPRGASAQRWFRQTRESAPIHTFAPSGKTVQIRAKTPRDQRWIDQVLAREWGGPMILIRERSYDASRLPALIAGDREGLATYALDGERAEIVTLNAFQPCQGIGTALLQALVDELQRLGVRELNVSTTNDNLDALRFYQRRGFRLRAVHAGEVDVERASKPSIPLTGAYGIPIHDAIELTRILEP